MGQPGARKFVSGSAVEREATCSEGSGASALTWGLFLASAWRLLFQACPLSRDDQPGNMSGAEGVQHHDTRRFEALVAQKVHSYALQSAVEIRMSQEALRA